METIATILKTEDFQILKIPKEFNLKAKRVKIISKDNYFILKPIKEKPRKGWSEAFKEMRRNNEDKLLIDDVLEEDIDV